MLPSLTPAVRVLLILNVGIFILQQVLGETAANILGLHHPESAYFLPFQFVTYMFLHGSFMHLFSNMFALLNFGPLLESFWGQKRFVFFYFFTGIGAGILYSGIHHYELMGIRDAAELFLSQPDPTNYIAFVNDFAPQLSDASFAEQFLDTPNSPGFIMQATQNIQLVQEVFVNSTMIGASGSVFGLLMAFGMIFPDLQLGLLFIPVPIKAKYFVALYGLFELYAGIQRSANDNVAHFAHLGGMFFAFIIIKYWGTRPQNIR